MKKKRLTGIEILALLLVLLGAMFYFSYGPVEYEKDITIVAFGDSLTRGYGTPPGKNFVTFLSEYTGIPIINSGKSGDTTSDALIRLKEDVLDHDPDIVIVALGGNDYFVGNGTEVVRANLTTIIRRIKREGVKVILIGGGKMCDLRCARSIVGVTDSDKKLPEKWIFVNSTIAVGDWMTFFLRKRGFERLVTEVCDKKLRDFREEDIEDGYFEEPEEFRFSNVYVLNRRTKKISVYAAMEDPEEKEKEFNIGEEVSYSPDPKLLKLVAIFSRHKPKEMPDFEALNEKIEKMHEKYQRAKDSSREQITKNILRELESLRSSFEKFGVAKKEHDLTKEGIVSPQVVLENCHDLVDGLIEALNKKERVDKHTFILAALEFHRRVGIVQGVLSALVKTGAYKLPEEKNDDQKTAG